MLFELLWGSGNRQTYFLSAFVLLLAVVACNKKSVTNLMLPDKHEFGTYTWCHCTLCFTLTLTPQSLGITFEHSGQSEYPCLMLA